MEQDQEFKHVCKFCSKSFPCGRSLGGHMRSHITNMSAEKKTEEKLAATTTAKLSSSLNNGGSGSYSGYGLRENPKKTCRFADSSEDTLMLVSDKFCKECGKGFPSWKALFGHMKCHSDQKERVSNNSLLEDQDSWTNANATTQKLVMDSQSDNETTAPNRRRRSKRRTRYMNTATTSSISFANPSSSLSEVEQEQEEVAMSLMMLSRDVSPWSGFNSVAESSDNNSPYFETPSSVGRTNLVTKIEGKNGSEIAAKVFKPSEFSNSVSATNLNSKGKSSELLAAGSPEKGFGMNNTRVSINGVIFKNEKSKKSELDSVSALEDSEWVLSKSATKYTSINKTKFLESELKSNTLKNWVNKPSEAEFSKNNSHKRGKFECTTCNKIFHSYQALGGHRASHKKIKGCFASRNESGENSIEFETELSPGPTTESKLMKDIDNENVVEEHELVGAGFDNEEITDTVTESKKNKVHECPICLKVFPSGQALGGHKRSHLISGSESTRNFQSQTVPIQEPVPEIRDFLDLNLPAATEEESNNSHADSYTPWWVVEGRNHKQQNNMVGLMSN